MPGTPETIGIAAGIYPDVGIGKTHQEGPGPAAGTTASAPVRMRTVMTVPVPQVRIEIRDLKSRDLITLIELLSPTNKQGKGRRKYLAKRRVVLGSTAHLVEIDLLRRGRRVPMTTPYPPGDYFVCVSRAELRPETEVWPLSVRQPLPTVPIPLEEGDPDVPLDLQNALTTVYDTAAYGGLIDYRLPPEPPLGEEDAAWAETLLQKRVLR